MTLAAASLKAESAGKSCLVCRYLQVRHHGEDVMCAVKILPTIIAAEWSDTDTKRAKVRALKCAMFDDMRP
jgi:hypothetical protein